MKYKPNSQDIICISNTTWEGDYMKAIVQMMSLLSVNHKLLFVDYSFTIKDLIVGLFFRIDSLSIQRTLGIQPRVRRIKAGNGTIFHLTLPPVLPINWIKVPSLYDFFNKINSWLIRRTINKTSDKLAMKQPVVINGFNPIAGVPLVGKLGESQLIYYCYDEISAAEWCKNHGTRLEKKFMRMADKVVVTSDNLYNSKKKYNPSVFLIKNGVDFDLFSKGANVDYQGKKTVGYVGSVDERLDYILLEKLVAENPDIEFLFIGRIVYPDGKQKLEKYSNTVFLGPKKPFEIPDYLKNIQIGIIPFRKNEFTRNIYPLKINEYLAAGKPVVTTNFAPLNDFRMFVDISGDHEEFNQHLRNAFNKTGYTHSYRFQIEANRNSWQNRSELFEKILKKHEKQTGLYLIAG